MADKFKENRVSLDADPGYTFCLDWEEKFDFAASIKTLSENPEVPFIIAVILYLLVIYIGQMLMHKREPFKVRVPMVLWNSALAIFSIAAFLRFLPEFLHSLYEFGFEHSICNNSWIHVKQCRFWVLLFILSKTPELGDTIFLVLRKQKLIFLHVYHHSSVLIFCWFVYTNTLATTRWFCVMNSGVHSIMYTYYVLKAFPNFVKVPRTVSIIITSLQITQMVVGTYVSARAYYSYLIGRDCATTTLMSIVSFAIYMSYLLLFARFFYGAYSSSPIPKDSKSITSAGKKRA